MCPWNPFTTLKVNGRPVETMKELFHRPLPVAAKEIEHQPQNYGEYLSVPWQY